MEVIVGTAGHIDHGKTALVRALTGTDADRLPEEKRRGITIDLGFAEMHAGDIHFGFVDVPGHERFVKNMLAGASGIDLVILVIAADDGVMPQTREHFDICHLLGVRSGLIAITKIDLVDDETLGLARLEASELVADSFLDGAPIVSVSTRTGAGVEDLRLELSRVAAGLTKSQSSVIARLPIDRSFSMKGFGAVVTGTLASGTIAEGDELDLLPRREKVRVRGIQSHGRNVSKIAAGTRVAINLAGVDHSKIERGMLLAEPNILEPTQMIDVGIDVLPTAPKPLRTRQRVRLHIGTAEVLARVQVLNVDNQIEADTRDFAQLTLEKPVVAISGERFIIRSYSPQTTIAGGEVIDNAPKWHRRREFSRVNAQLARLASAKDNADREMIMIEASGDLGVSRVRLRARTGFTTTESRLILDGLIRSQEVVDTGDWFINTDAYNRLLSKTRSAVEDFHTRKPLALGISRDEMRAINFKALPEPVEQSLIGSLIKNGSLIADGDILRLATFTNVLSSEESSVSNRILETLSGGGLSVDKIADIIADGIDKTSVSHDQARKLLEIHIASGDVVRVSPDFCFAATAIDGLIKKLAAFAENSPARRIDVAQFKEIAGVSRKHAIPLLEYLDGKRITVRAGDKRVIS